MQIEVVGVRFKNSCYTYKFSPNALKLEVGEKVLVETDKGSELATIVQKEHVIDATMLDEGLKKVVRKLSSVEVENAEKYSQQASEHFPQVKKIVSSLNLEMKVISVDSNFDFSKIIVNFTSDDRVDFRVLAKKLADKFGKKIELRQIGARDAVRILGGIGVCGKECCCRQGFGEGAVSIKMAKNQSLSLNPNSINGLCGKLLCCLSYENSNYVEMMRNMPKINSFVSTPEGKGRVTYNNLFEQKVTVKVEKNNSVEIKEFDLDKIKFDKN